IDKAGTGYTLTASATGLTGATSNAFNVVTPVSAGAHQTISAGVDYTCGVTPSAGAYCWGYNGSGQLGNGTIYTSTTPDAVSGGVTFEAVSAGVDHTCGVTPSGAAYCWGVNAQGQLGNGTTTGSTTPVAVSGGLTFAAVSAGSLHTCGVTSGGAAYC